MGVSSDDTGVPTDEGMTMGTPLDDTMRNVLGRLVLWMAEILDRSLITVPDLDLNDAYSPSPLSQFALRR
jgi:hypothetical protein